MVSLGKKTGFLAKAILFNQILQTLLIIYHTVASKTTVIFLTHPVGLVEIRKQEEINHVSNEV